MINIFYQALKILKLTFCRDIDTHTHRVGRTGRAGVKGDAYTLITANDKEFAGHIVRYSFIRTWKAF